MAAAGAVAKAPASRQAPPPAWKTLSPAQQEALAPLAPVWGEISSNRKRKWIALSANFESLSPADKATLQGRMKEWASLSTADRNRARLNFAQTQELSSAEKKAKWEAYQALSPERKRQLAARPAPRRPAQRRPSRRNCRASWQRCRQPAPTRCRRLPNA